MNKEEKLIKKCPVCGSVNLEQEYESIQPMLVGGESISWGSGSHCKNCGVRFAFNFNEKSE